MIFQEDEHTELKESVKSNTLINAIVAFLNTCDGVIYIGVKDDGTPIGVSNLDETMLRISDIIANEISPHPENLITVNSFLESGKTIVCIQIRQGVELFYIKKYGLCSIGCYKRVGTSSRGMSEKEIANIYRKITFAKIDISEVLSDQLKRSFSYLEIYYEAKGFHLDKKSMEWNLNLRRKSDGKYNLLANLLADENNISLKIARFRGTDKSQLDEMKDYGYQCLLKAMDRMLDRLEAENYTLSVIGYKTRKDKRLVDMTSLREAFINAIAHNDWMVNSPAVYVFSDRIEIFSYGGLPYGQTKEMFFMGTSNPRNASLMRILSDLEYVEQTGHGVPEIVKNYGTEVFEINDFYIKVKIPYDNDVKNSHIKNKIQNNQKHNGRKEDLKDEEILINAIKNNPHISTDEMAKLIKKTRRTVARIINSNSKFVRVGSDKGGYWIIKDKS